MEGKARAYRMMGIFKIYPNSKLRAKYGIFTLPFGVLFT
jgi:hypothetical protein